MKLRLWAAALLSVAAGTIPAADFPGMRSYLQTVKLRYATEAEAEKAELRPMALPNWYRIAFSGRWDDNALNHYRTHAAMTDHRIKGTFYLTDPGRNKKVGAEFCRKLLEKGCSLGIHTLSHPFLPTLNPNEQFYEIMHLRAIREADSDSMFSTMVYPYCRFGSNFEPEIILDLGRAMRNTGVIGAPTVRYNKQEKAFGYPEETLAESYLLRPGDRDPNPETFHKQLSSALNNGKALEQNPCISISMHSWHTEEGLNTLRKLLREVADCPDWWYCNQNEYAAYRFEFHQTKVTKKVEGKEALFTIERFEPATLGADPALWFSLAGAKPQAVEGAVLKVAAGRMALELPHDAAYRLPETISLLKKDGTFDKFPYLTGSMEKTGETIAVKLVNKGDVPMTRLTLTLRCGAAYTPDVQVRKPVELAPGKSIETKFQLGTMRSELRYRLGKPYFVVEADFLRDGKACRAFLPLRLEADSSLRCIGTTARTFGPVPENFDLSKISLPGSAVSLPELTAGDRVKSAENAIAFRREDKNSQVPAYKVVSVVEFEPVAAGEILFRGDVAELWVNGEKAVKNKSGWLIPVREGKNRVVAVSTENRGQIRLARWLVPEAGKVRSWLVPETEKEAAK